MESTLVFPVVLLSTTVLMFTALWIYRTSFLYGTAAAEAQRAAFVWDDSTRDDATGRTSPGKGDGLYWRISGDLFNAGLGLFGGEGTRVMVPQAEPPSGLMEHKLDRSAHSIPRGMYGEIAFKSNGWLRKVTVDLKDTFFMPLSGARLSSGIGASYVAEPTEWIRMIDLTRTYAGEIKDRISPRQASELFQEREGTTPEEPVPITSEREAAAYLRKLVSGTEREFVTPSGKQRIVDALDASGIAHQAFYTYSETQLLTEQLPKDVELLTADGQVRGVVWHFFKDGKYEPSASLAAKLERKGIIVVIH